MIAFLLAAALAAGAPAPMVDEDVVRLLAAGRSPDEVVRAIDAHEVQFDLSDEMIAELRLAGVPERVLEAMRARQARFAPPPAAPKAVAPAPPDPRSIVTVHVLAAPAVDGALWFPGTAGDALAKVLQLGRTPAERKIDDLAVFVACTTPDHVPDQWRSRSPLGRDFISMPRHEMLSLHAGAVRVPSKEVPRAVRSAVRDGGAGAGEEWLRLDLPFELAAPLRPDAEHDLFAGVAILVGETYLVVASDERRSVLPSAWTGGMQVSAGRGDGKSEGLEIHFTGSEPRSP